MYRTIMLFFLVAGCSLSTNTSTHKKNETQIDAESEANQNLVTVVTPPTPIEPNPGNTDFSTYCKEGEKYAGTQQSIPIGSDVSLSSQATLSVSATGQPMGANFVYQCTVTLNQCRISYKRLFNTTVQPGKCTFRNADKSEWHEFPDLQIFFAIAAGTSFPSPYFIVPSFGFDSAKILRDKTEECRRKILSDEPEEWAQNALDAFNGACLAEFQKGMAMNDPQISQSRYAACCIPDKKPVIDPMMDKMP